MFPSPMRHGEALPVGGAIREDARRPLSLLESNQVRQVAEGLNGEPDSRR